MTMFRYAEQGSIGFLWIAGTNPAVSMPDLARIRRILAGEQCFVVVSDGYRTKTSALADVVLPAALWGEKTGTATNVDRTVHLFEQAVELPDDDYPLRLTTGRTVYHWHTRTKTKRAAPLQQAAPAMWVEMSAPDAARLGIDEGDIVRVSSRRGSIEAPARISYIREGVVFAPWHYGGSADTAANELTLSAWDPVSKQPEFKVAAVSVQRVRAGDRPAPAPSTTASAPVHGAPAPARPSR
jgi:anaerobic selenocysteine-containing dehydrogenase